MVGFWEASVWRRDNLYDCSNNVSKKNFFELAQLLNAKYEERVLLSEEDFERDGHEAEILCRIGPIARVSVNIR